MKAEYIYLLREREFIKTKENIQKVGKSTQKQLKRFKQYPKNSILLCQIMCSDCDAMEKKILELFKKKYIRCKHIGNEYFEGDYKSMIRDINSIIELYDVESDESDQSESEDEEIDIIDVSNFIEECTMKSKSHIHTSILYESYKKWCLKKALEEQEIPSNKIFVENLRQYITVTKSVRVGEKCSIGVKYLELK